MFEYAQGLLWIYYHPERWDWELQTD